MWGDNMYFKLNRELEQIDSIENLSDKEDVIVVLTFEEWKEVCKKNDIYSNYIDFNKISFSKSEVYRDIIVGTFYIPKMGKGGFQGKFGYYIKKHRMYFIDNDNVVKPIIDRLKERREWKNPSIAHFLYDFLDILISNDLNYLEHFETNINELEDRVLIGDLKNFNYMIVNMKRQLLILNNYYDQLIEMGLVFEENEEDIFENAYKGLFKIFTNKVSRLNSKVDTLMEYTRHLRDLYQAQADIKQNRTMQTLTIITAVFSPLTLIVGWYGMNFVYMPEITWKYGYVGVILLSIAVIIFCYYMIKKHFH